jgi:molybdate transport system regulatory protein
MENNINIAAPLWFLFRGRELLSEKAIALLHEIDSKGSLYRAAASVDISYRTAWNIVDKLNNASNMPVVISATGGRNGGGSQLSEYGKSLLKFYSTLEKSYENISSQFKGENININEFMKTIKGLCMKTSARNQLSGIVTKIAQGMITSEIVVDIGTGLEITTLITNESVKELNLAEGSYVIVLVKAPSVVLFPADIKTKCSMENILLGTVTETRIGQVNSEVILSLPGGKTITSIVTIDSFESLEIKEGNKVYAAFSSSQAIIALPM